MMKLRDYVLNQINHVETSPVPFTLGFEGDVAQRLDEYYGGDDWRERLTPYIVRVPGVNNMSREPIDDTYEKDKYGGIWKVDRRPYHLEEPPMSEPNFDDYDLPPPEEFFITEEREVALQRCEKHSDSFLIAGMGWGLFETSWGVRGFQNVLTDCVAHPDFYAELLERIKDLFLAFVDYAADLPVDGVFFGDDWGDQRGVIIGPERWREFLKPRWAEVYDAVHDNDMLVLSHCCGSVADIMPDIIEIELDVLESVQPEAMGMDPFTLKKQWGDEITFWGGLGSQSTIPFGTPNEISQQVRRLCEQMGRGGGYILAPAKGLQPETPTENAVAVVEAFTNQV